MTTLQKFINEGWFCQTPDCEESIILFYMLYTAWCEGEKIEALGGEELTTQLEDLGIFRFGECLRGIEFSKKGEAVVAHVLQKREDAGFNER